MSVDKHIIRTATRRRRRELPAADVNAAGTAVFAQLRNFVPFQAARAVIAYLAHENEVPTDAIVAATVRGGRRLFLPRSGSVPTLAPWSPDEPLERAIGGTRQPYTTADCVVERPAVMFLPVVAWDVTGARLGRGAGFYDRLVARLGPEIVRVGLAYEFQEIAHIPREAWDAVMHYVITERRIVRCVSEHMQSPMSLGIQKGGRQLE